MNKTSSVAPEIKVAPEIRIAPEIKAGPETMTAAFEDFMGAFEAFKETNDRRLGELEGKLTADIVTRDKMDRISRTMDEQKRLIDQMALKKARPALGRSGETNLEASEHKAAFESYIRRGDEQALRELEAKAFSIGSASDGGYLVPNETDTEIGRRLSAVSPIRAMATVRQVSGAVLKKPFALAGMATGWVAETAARPQTTTPQLAELSFPTMELYAMPAATRCTARRRRGRYRELDRLRGRYRFRRAGGHGLRVRRRHQQAEGVPQLYQRGRGELELGQHRLYRHRRCRRLQGERPVRHADRHDLCAEGRATGRMRRS